MNTLDRRQLLIVMALSIAYVFPIVLTNGLYIDDLGRIITGLAWMHDGRVITSILMTIISGGYPITDIWPWGNILSACILGLSGIIICNSFSISTKTSIPLSLVILCSPFMLENLSYRFDSLSMSLSILAICIPFLFKDRIKPFIFYSILGIYVSLQTYQASATSYFVIVCFLVILYSKSSLKSAFTLGISSVASFFVAVLISYATWRILTLQMNGRGETIKSISELKTNINGYLDLLSSSFSAQFALSLSLIACVSIYAIISMIINKRINIYSKVISILSLIFCIIASIGPSLVLSDSWWTPRIMVGFPFVILGLMLFSLSCGVKEYIIRSCAYVYIFSAFVLCSAYSNATNANNSYIDNVLNYTSQYLSSSNQVNLIINGNMKRSERVKIYDDKFPILKHLIPTYMSNSWTWGVAQFKKNDLIGIGSWGIRSKRRDHELKTMCSYDKIAENKEMYIYKKNDIIILDFNKTDCLKRP